LCATFLNKALRQFGFEKTGHRNLLTVCKMEPSLTKKKEGQQLHGILGLAKYEGEQLDLLRSASESESSRAVVDHAVGSYSVALGAVLDLVIGKVIGNIWTQGLCLMGLEGLDQHSLVEVLMGSIIYQRDKGKLEEADKGFKVTVLWGPAKDVAGIGGRALGQLFLSVYTGGLPVQEGTLQRLSWVDNMKEMQGMQWGMTVELAMHQCKELVGIYTIYEEDQGHGVYFKREIFKNILREALSSLNFSSGDVAHAALCSRVLAAGGSLAAVASASYS